jgi:signal transduction histidine kinase
MLVTAISQSEAKLGKAARVLHDDVGQILSAVGLQLDVMRMDLQARVPEIAERTAEIQKMLEGVMGRIRDLSRELNPSVVDRAGLQSALERLVRHLQEKYSGVMKLQFNTGVRAPREAARNLYRIAECALQNAVTHSGADKIDVAVTGEGNRIVLEVRDNGCGFDLTEARAKSYGTGLLLMECYAAAENIALTIETAPGKGTIVRTGFPIAK